MHSHTSTHTYLPPHSKLNVSIFQQEANKYPQPSELFKLPASHTATLPASQHVCVCACTSDQEHACAFVSIQLFPLCQPGEINLSQRARAFQQINHSGNPIVFQAHLFTNQINSHPLYSSCSKQDTTQDETVAPKRQSHRFLSGDTHLFLTFHSTRCFGSELVIKRNKCIFLAFAFLVGIQFLWRNLLTCKCQT